MTLRIMAAAALAAGSMALFAASAARAAETVYPLATVQLYATASGGAAIGSATPGTPLAVTAAAAGGREQVMVEGWSRKGGESVVLQAPGLRILLAKLTPAAVSARKLLGQQTDSYGTVWEHVAVPVWVETNAVVNNLATVWDQARQRQHGDHRQGKLEAFRRQPVAHLPGTGGKTQRRPAGNHRFYAAQDSPPGLTSPLDPAAAAASPPTPRGRGCCVARGEIFKSV